MICLDFEHINALNYKDYINASSLNGYEGLNSFIDTCDAWYKGDSSFEFQTSGSTSRPKIITFHRSQVEASCKQTIDYFGLNKGDKLLLCLPLSYVAGKMMLLRAIVGGFKLFLSEDNKFPWSGLNETIDFGAMVPMQLDRLENREQSLKIRHLLLGGAPLQSRHISQIKDLGLKAYESFGMTETLSHFAMKRLFLNEEAYTLLPNVKIKYGNDNVLSVIVPWIKNDWLQTDDVVEIQGVNKFIWKGRQSNVINSGGVKLHPESIESKLQSFFSSRAYFIYSLPSSKYGEKIGLFIEGAPINNIENQLSSCLSSKERPKAVYYIPQFKYSTAGKLLKRESAQSVISDL